MSVIGFHFVDNVYDGASRARWLQHIIAIKPRHVVVLVGAQRAEAIQFVAEGARNSPQTSFIIRHYADGGDDGMWKRIEPEDYIRRIGGMYKTMLADVDSWYLMPDNEFSSLDRNEVDSWQGWQARMAMDAHKAGIKLALGCQPTHHPHPDQINSGWYDVLYHTLKLYPEHLYYRNVYYDADNRDGLKYVRHIAERMKQVTKGYVPTIVIGELARLRSIRDAQHGYKSVGLTTETLAKEALLYYRTYLQGLSPKGVYACWYCVGDWPIGRDTFNIASDNGFFKVLSEAAHEKLPDTKPLPDDDVPEPEPVDPPTTPVPAVATREYVNLQLMRLEAQMYLNMASEMMRLGESYKAKAQAILNAMEDAAKAA